MQPPGFRQLCLFLHICHDQGRFYGGQGGHNAPVTKLQGGAKKTEQCHKHFLQYGTFSPKLL